MTNAAIHIDEQLHPHAHDAAATGAVHAKGQQHPIKLYLVVWGWLFVLSTGSYLVDYFGLHGYLRWSLILLFMVLKAGLIVAVFMHMAWERLALATPSCFRRCWCWYLYRSWCSSPTTRTSSGSCFSRRRYQGCASPESSSIPPLVLFGQTALMVGSAPVSIRSNTTHRSRTPALQH